MAGRPPSQPGADNAVLLGHYEILTDGPLPQLDGGAGRLFAARATDQRAGSAVALLARERLPARADIMPSMKALEHPSILKVLDWGTVHWPADGRSYEAILYERPPGPPLFPTLDAEVAPYSEDRLVRSIVAPLSLALRELGERAIFHGQINPTNLFPTVTAGGAMLGDCVSAPPGFRQLAVCETVERASAQPAGRGPGTLGDDLYALGVTLMFFLIGKNPVAGLSEAEVIDQKMDRGSFPTLTGQHRLPMSVQELVRGLTTDDPKQRWTLEDLLLWLSGRRLTPKQAYVAKRATRAFDFDGKEYWRARALAAPFTANTRAAAKLIDNGELDRWLRRSAGDGATADRVQTAIQSAASAGRGAGFEERLVTRVAVALDPTGPIRLRGASVLPKGLAGALAEAMVRNQGAQAVAEIITSQVVLFWYNQQPEFRADSVPVVQVLDAQRAFLERRFVGYGLERVLYEMVPNMPCMSELIERFHPTRAVEVLTALEAIAAERDRPKLPYDRHIVAFLVARERRISDMTLVGLGTDQPDGQRLLLLLGVFANIQMRTGPSALPRLTEWFASHVDLTLERLHSRTRRERVREAVLQAVGQGYLPAVQQIVDNPRLLKDDEQGFGRARARHAQLEIQARRLERDLADGDRLGFELGRQIATLLCGSLAALGLGGMIFAALASGV